jgi:hypothetical protein
LVEEEMGDFCNSLSLNTTIYLWNLGLKEQCENHGASLVQWQEDGELYDSLNYIARPCLKQMKQNKTQKPLGLSGTLRT